MAMNRTLASGVAVVVVGLLVGACSVLGGKAAEEPKYRIVLADGDIEVRAYEPYAVAWTTVDRRAILTPQYQATSITYRADRRATHAPNNTPTGGLRCSAC